VRMALAPDDGTILGWCSNRACPDRRDLTLGFGSSPSRSPRWPAPSSEQLFASARAIR